MTSFFSFFDRIFRRKNSGAWDEFYYAFEQKFRGSFEEVKARHLERYGEKLRQLAKGATPKAGGRRILDLGCGRGEFLAVCTEMGWEASGIDLNETAVGDAKKRGLAARYGDIVSHLRTIPSGSIELISSFHVVEHCDPRYTFEIFQETSRVLTPGGVFLCETPSATSLYAAGRNFCLDPTHKQPIHPSYMEFLATHCGFKHSEILSFSPHFGADRGRVADALQGNARSEMEKMEGWLYGPMDTAIWSVR